MSKTSVCPLDCYDACRIILGRDGRLKGDLSHPVTKGYLCPNINHYDDYPRLHTPTYKGQDISWDEGFDRLLWILGCSAPEDVLYYRGSGNLGLMQRSLGHFFGKYGAVGTHGSLCDGAGEAGIIQGRGVNYPLSPSMIEKSEVVIIWGRNIETTHSHLLPILKQKRLIIIDPIRIALSDHADFYFQIRPGSDLHLALALCRILRDLGKINVEQIKNQTDGFEEFSILMDRVNVKDICDFIGVKKEQMVSLIELAHSHKTAILVGVGVQKYAHGADVLRAIDAIGILLGLFGNEGCGVSYVGSSLQDLDLPFDDCARTVPIPTLNFADYTVAFIQGGNPLAQLPNSNRVREQFHKCEHTVYFGTMENETSHMADLVIPAKSFLEKLDVRASYGDYTLGRMEPLREESGGISEYELTSWLCRQYEIPFFTEEFILKEICDQIEIMNGVEYKKIRPEVPYKNGFKTSSGKFEFIRKTTLTMDVDENFYFITAKSSRSLNSQFKRSSAIYMNRGSGFVTHDEVKVSSPAGSIRMVVINDDRLRLDTVLIYSGTPDVNCLTPSKLSDAGASAVYQDYKIKVEKW